ncbi:MAG: SH3 domain-containing protein [Caldilineaceae bacterium]|nr:SH3 domain-containing protein [Caldilineaceae bacterium]
MSANRYFVLIVLACLSLAMAGYGRDASAEQAPTTPANQVASETPPPQPVVPVLPIHNPLVVPIGDTPAALGGPFQDWPAVEDAARGLRIFHPQGWFFASSKEELSSLRPQMGDSAFAKTVLDRQAAHIDSLTQAGQEAHFVGSGFQYSPDTPPTYISGFDIRAITAAGRTLEQYTLQAAALLEESEFETLESVEVGPGLRPWGEETASIRYRSGGVVVEDGKMVTQPGTKVIGWQVVLLSPDGGTFLLITFDVLGREFDSWLEPLLRDIVRRVQWLEHPAYDPPISPSVTIARTMNVRGGPGSDHSILGSATAGEQYAAISTNAVGDWWQIEYDGQLAWVYDESVTPSADSENVRQADPASWLRYDDSARGLSLSYPSGWHYFDPAQPTQVDLALFSAAVRGRDGEQLDVAEMGALVSAMSVRRDDAVIGLGLQSGPADSTSSNFMLVFSLAAEGTTLERYAQVAAEHAYSIETASVKLVGGLRPSGERVVSIRYREYETASEVWQVVLLSPDGERLLVLAFSVHSGEFAATQPRMNGIVRRVRWTDVESNALPQPAVPLLSIHNPLVIPIGDTPAASEGLFQDWPAVEDAARGLKIFYPQGWLFASSKEEFLSLRPQVDDATAAETVLERQAAHIDSLTMAGQEDQLVGHGFQFAPDTAPAHIDRFDIRAIPAAGRTLEQYALQAAALLEESKVETLVSVGVGPGLRPWGEETASIRYRNGGAVVEEGKMVTQPGTKVIGWQVVLLSPDGGTFLEITFNVWGEVFEESLEPLLRDIVRRVQWTDHPAFDPPVGPTVTITRTMYVRGGPGTDHPIISTAIEAEQYAAISTNAAGDWWQIEYDGQLAWVYGGFVKPSADSEDALQADPTGWLTYDDSARGLSLSYPSGWHLFDPAQPSQVDLSLFSAAVKGREGEQLDVAEMGALVSAMSVRRDDAVIGIGLQSGPADSASSNFMLVFSLAAEGMTLERYAQMAAEHTYSIEPASIELVRGLRPLSEEAVSIRYRGHATASEVWQVVLLSSDGERILVLAFSVHNDEFTALQPVLREIVQRVRWAEPPSSGVGQVLSTPHSVPPARISSSPFPARVQAGVGGALTVPIGSGGSTAIW